jgi:hypothetical protein
MCVVFVMRVVLCAYMMKNWWSIAVSLETSAWKNNTHSIPSIEIDLSHHHTHTMLMRRNVSEYSDVWNTSTWDVCIGRAMMMQFKKSDVYRVNVCVVYAWWMMLTSYRSCWMWWATWDDKQTCHSHSSYHYHHINKNCEKWKWRERAAHLLNRLASDGESVWCHAHDA